MDLQCEWTGSSDPTTARRCPTSRPLQALAGCRSRIGPRRHNYVNEERTKTISMVPLTSTSPRMDINPSNSADRARQVSPTTIHANPSPVVTAPDPYALLLQFRSQPLYPLSQLCIGSQVRKPLLSPLPLSPRLSTGIITYSTTHLPTSNVLHLPLLLLYFTDILQAVEMPYKDDTPDSGFTTNVARRGG